MEKGKYMPTNDGYPTENELDRIKHWDVIKDPFGLIDFLESIWHWPDWGIRKEEGESEHSNKRCLKFHLSTGGWSGNESIIQVLQETSFWYMFWVSSQRGGHYEFEIPKNWGK
jgi:hypothetical protein